MEWKDGVIITKQSESEYHLQMDTREKTVLAEHVYILEKIQSGEHDDEQLLSYIAEQEKINEAAAGFTLAGFLIEYADYVAADTSHYEIR